MVTKGLQKETEKHHKHCIDTQFVKFTASKSFLLLTNESSYPQPACLLKFYSLLCVKNSAGNC